MAKTSTLKRATPRMKYVHMNHVVDFKDKLKERQDSLTDRDSALFEIKSLYTNVEEYHRWFNTLYDSTKSKGNIEAYDKAILEKLSDLRGEKELAADNEWLSSKTEPIENELLPTGEIPDSVCPKCKSALRITNKRNYMELTEKRQFVSCMKYPLCNYIARGISPDVRAKMLKVRAEIEAAPVEF